MRSKTSYSKLSPPLMRSLILRFWPVWSSYFVIWCMILTIPILTNSRLPYRGSYADTVQFLHRHITGAGGGPALAMTFVYGMIAAMCVWSFLMNSRSVSLYYALPVTRGTMFWSNWLTGLGFLLVPNAAVCGLTFLCQLSVGYPEGRPVLGWLIAVSLMSLLFYAIGTLAAVLTGSLAGVPAIYLLLNFGVCACEGLMNRLANLFYFGVQDFPLQLTVFSPIVRLAEGLPLLHQIGLAPLPSSSEQQYQLVEFNPEYLRILLWYALAALAVTVLARLLFHLRTSEAAGELIAIPWLRAPAKYCFTFGCSLALGTLLLLVFFPGTTSPAAVAACLLIGGAVGYFTAAMLLKKTFRVFRLRQLPGLICLSVLLCAWVFCLSADVFGIESRVPAPEEVSSVEVYAERTVTLSSPEDIREVCAIQQQILSEKEDILEGLRSEDVFVLRLYLHYTLKDGRSFNREYSLPYLPAETPEGSLGSLLTLLNRPDNVAAAVLPAAGVPVHSVIFSSDLLDGDGMGLSGQILPEDVDALLDALAEDIRQGRIGRWDTSHIGESSLFSFELTFGPHDDFDWIFLPVYTDDDPVSTLQFLRSRGYLDGAELPSS